MSKYEGMDKDEIIRCAVMLERMNEGMKTNVAQAEAKTERLKEKVDAAESKNLDLFVSEERLQDATRSLVVGLFIAGAFDHTTGEQANTFLKTCGFIDTDKVLEHRDKEKK